MPSIKQSISTVARIDREFTGTVAFRNEKLTLPDGSKVAIGIDGERWVIVYQQALKSPFIIYEYNSSRATLLIDKKHGSPQDMERVMQIVSYFFENAEVEDVVTIESGRAPE